MRCAATARTSIACRPMPRRDDRDRLERRRAPRRLPGDLETDGLVEVWSAPFAGTPASAVKLNVAA